MRQGTIGGRGALRGVVVSRYFPCRPFGLVPVYSKLLLRRGGEDSIRDLHIVPLLEVKERRRVWNRLNPGVRGCLPDVGYGLDLPISPCRYGILVLRSRDRAHDDVFTLFPSDP